MQLNKVQNLEYLRVETRVKKMRGKPKRRENAMTSAGLHLCYMAFQHWKTVRNLFGNVWPASR